MLENDRQMLEGCVSHLTQSLLGRNGLLTAWMVCRIRKIDFQMNFLQRPMPLRPGSRWLYLFLIGRVCALLFFGHLSCGYVLSSQTDAVGLPFTSKGSCRAVQGLFSESLSRWHCSHMYQNSQLTVLLCVEENVDLGFGFVLKMANSFIQKQVPAVDQVLCYMLEGRK